MEVPMEQQLYPSLQHLFALNNWMYHTKHLYAGSVAADMIDNDEYYLCMYKQKYVVCITYILRCSAEVVCGSANMQQKF
jgi:hypothetical protein